MPRGQVLTIPNGQAVLTTTLSREQKASIALLNPNDGVLYVHLNGPAQSTPTMWDWKVPSQSYCQLPGPWESLGIYYSDQSGSGRSAEVNVYESDSQIAIPSFIAIGRAVQQAGSAVDITQGAQPTNPPLGSSRLWVDGSGNLHILDPNGNDQQIITNTTALGGDLYGTIPNAHIRLLSSDYIQAIDNGGVARNILGVGVGSGQTQFWNAGGGVFIWYNQLGTVGVMTLDGTTGNASIGGTLHSSSYTVSDGGNGIITAGAGNLYLRALNNNNWVILDQSYGLMISGTATNSPGLIYATSNAPNSVAAIRLGSTNSGLGQLGFESYDQNSWNYYQDRRALGSGQAMNVLSGIALPSNPVLAFIGNISVGVMSLWLLSANGVMLVLGMNGTWGTGNGQGGTHGNVFYHAPSGAYLLQNMSASTWVYSVQAYGF